MKKNTLSLLETIKRKIKKIDDSDKAPNLGKAVDREFEYLEDGQESLVESQEKGQGEVVDADNSDADDLKLEADIENSASDANSIGEESSQNNSQIDENKDFKGGEDIAANPDSSLDIESPEDGDDFDLTFENHSEDDFENDIDLGGEGSLDDGSFEVGGLESAQEEVFSSGEGFEDLAIGTEEEGEKNSEFLRGEEGLAGPESGLGLQGELSDDLEFNENEGLGSKEQSLDVAESLPEEGVLGEAQNFDEPVESKVNEASEESLDFNLDESVNEELDHNLGENVNEELGLELDEESVGVDEVYEFEESEGSSSVDDELGEKLEFPVETSNEPAIFDNQQVDVQQDNADVQQDNEAEEGGSQYVEDPIQNEIHSEDGAELSERKEDLDILDESYFTAEDHPEESQNEEALDKQSSGGFSAKSFTDILAEEKLKEEQAADHSAQELETSLNDSNVDELQLEESGPEAEVVAEEMPVTEVYEEKKQEQEREMESLIEDEIDPLSQFGDLGLDDTDAVGDSDDGDSNDGLYETDSPNVINSDESQNVDFDKELSLGDEAVSDESGQVQEGALEEEEEVLEEERPVDNEQNVEIDNSQKSDDDFMKELELEEANQKDASEDAMLNADIASKVSQSIKNLQDTKAMVGKVEDFAQSDLLSHVAFELMRPKLEQWLNDNLPKLVENVVREEIEKIISTNSD